MLDAPADAEVFYDFGGLRVGSAFSLPGLAPLRAERQDDTSPVIQISLSHAPPPIGRWIYQYGGGA